MKKHILIFIFVLLFIPLVLSETYKQNEPLDLKTQCIANGTYCSASAYCNITIQYPNASLLINNAKMTNQIAFFNYTLKDSSTLGNYACTFTCCDSGYCATNSCDFKINGIGYELTIQQSILYIILLSGILIILLFTIWGAIVMPFKNPRDEEDGKILSINDLKYFKIILWIMVYLEVLFLILILRNLSGGFLGVEGTYSFFNITYNMLLIGLLPMFPLVIFFTIVIWLSDKKTLKNLARGLPT